MRKRAGVEKFLARGERYARAILRNVYFLLSDC